MHCRFCCCWHHHWNLARWLRNSGTEFKRRIEIIPLLALSQAILNLTKSPEIIKTNQLTESEFSSLCNQYNQTVNDPNFTEDQLDSLVGMIKLNNHSNKMIVFRGYKSNVVSFIGNDQDNDELLPNGTIHQRNESLFIIESSS